MQLVGRVIDHSVRSPAQLAEERRTTADIWRQRYPDEPFDAAAKPPASSTTQPNYRRASSYDLTAAVGRQSKFFYHVSLPHYRDDRFLTRAAARYRRFLGVKARHRDAVLVPTYDVDLVWHTHQLHPTGSRLQLTATSHSLALSRRSHGLRSQGPAG